MVQPLVQITLLHVLVNKHPEVTQQLFGSTFMSRLDTIVMVICTVPASSLAAVAEQTHQVLVPDAPDRLNLHSKIFLGLTPDQVYSN